MALPSRITNTRDGAEAVLVPGGRFTLGVTQQAIADILKTLKQPTDPIFRTEQPPRMVLLRDFYIDRCPVTNRQYGTFVAATNHAQPLSWREARYNLPNQPVSGINYRDAAAYALWAGKRLPTEDEWEHAARGEDDRIWPWGNEFDRLRCNCRESNVSLPTEVGIYPAGASPYGVLDLSGNVWELTSSQWEGFGVAIRGGSYRNPASFCRTTTRWGMDPDVRGSTWLGFRCVMDVTRARIVARAIQP
jgi:formylglycine-generating enzyme required for sulfatase activity